MGEKPFTLEQWTEESLYYSDGEYSAHMSIGFICEKVEKKLNEQQATIDKQDKAIREALKVLADSKNYQSVISFKYGLQYATKLLKRVIDDE